ncbi:hypothetical protein BU14_0375s0006 [Porphyra umbilicalis]|uniref:60S acidic ribosomal protein P0 n=1 Tax=Porphyra umbilicalis TaxID=2786 RepID=A0A1X6NWW0_PORUM|nr:hypothetical protein BU14_0375s0006 [Porphyra umbilicalis]|eukprot:OSX73119.1 hypothetical protein BU14_0375s0006 [Porphyra umbilicalis]
MAKMAKKEAYAAKLLQYFDEYDKMFVVQADNVGSNQLQQLRAQVRENTVLLMGKNTMIRRVLRNHGPENPDLLTVLPVVVGNIGMVFTKGDLKEVRDKIASNKVPAAAKAGTIAQCEVFIEPGPTGMEPTMTSFFQALNIPTKINRGQIEIQSRVKLLDEGQKVGSSEVALLQKLGIRPFSYGLKFLHVFENGQMYSPKVLDITDDDLLAHVKSGLNNIAAISLATNYPTQPSVAHSMRNGLKNLVAVSLATDYVIDAAKELKELLDNPEALAAMAAAAASGGGGGGDDAKEEAPAAAEEEEESEDDDMGFGLFD